MLPIRTFHCQTIASHVLNLQKNKGVSLIVVLLILVIVSLLGVASIQISKMATQAARNERDTQLAFQAAEAALIDAELDILGLPATAKASRGKVFDHKAPDLEKFGEECGNTSENKGLCRAKTSETPHWLSIDFLATKNPQYVEFGEFTSRTFQHGNAGIQPAHPPRYIIELMDDPTVDVPKILVAANTYTELQQ